MHACKKETYRSWLTSILSSTLVCYCLLPIHDLHAFQEFESDTSLIPPQRFDGYDERVFANAPYSFCEYEKIPVDWCLKIGLSLWDVTFRNIAVHTDFFKRFEYNVNDRTANHAWLHSIENRYFTPPYRHQSFYVPSEGQLAWLFKNGWVDKGPAGTKHFIRKSGTSGYSLAIVEKGYSAAFYTQRAKLQRLVTKDVPSLCTDIECADFREPAKKFHILFRNSACSGTWRWRVKYKLFNYGIWQNETVEANGEGKFEVDPAIHKNIDISIKQWTSGWKTHTDIMTKFRQDAWTEIECFRGTGNCVSWGITNYPQCGWCFQGIGVCK